MTEVNFFDHFQLPWARNGTVEGITDSQWQAGWSFVGGTPPSVEQFNKLQQMTDEKAAWLYKQCRAAADHFGFAITASSDDVLLRGLGNHSGAVVIRDTVALDVDALGKVLVIAQSLTVTLPPLSAVPEGATIALMSTANATVATAGGDLIQFNGIESSSSRSVAFSGGDSLVVVSIGTSWYAVSGTAQLRHAESFRAARSILGYQVLPSGLVLQWGAAGVAANTTATLAYPVAFPTAALSIIGSRRIGTNATFNFETLSATQYRAQNTAPVGETGNWLAIGY
jgi:hypothetical protein